MNANINKYPGLIFLVPGLLFLLLAGIGIVTPIIPTVPFILAAAWCITKSSPGLGSKVTASRIYRMSAGRFNIREGIPLRDKVSILVPVIVILLLLFLYTENPVTKTVIAAVAVIKVIFFMCIKTR